MRLQRGVTLAAVAAVLLLWPEAAGAQQEKPMTMEMPKPAPEMEKYKWMARKWAVKETHEKSDFGPGGPGKGTAVITLGPGGFSHIMEYNSTGPNGKFSGRGITVWDPNTKSYRGVWVDSMTPGLMMMDCREEGQGMTCTGEGEVMGKKMTMRSRADSVTPQGWTEVMEISTDGGPYQKMMTLEYKPAK